ncbi:Serine/threonine-protein kinase PknB [Posidoniimonas polymericola]|uniref:Serine/threonine-protein kinase PknB n=2 Tax=Posidoniimonas polymericola TaxID=2528002 RepID=A0A5C5YQ66_9BACT|nr:Serine/threonine-protein kinase PknB [Posidoniimonas polymericola]
MTWASRTVAGTVVRTRRFLSRELWVWPIIAVLLLVGIGWGVHGSIERTMEANLKSELQTLLDVEVAMLRTWLTSQETNAKSTASDTDVRQLVGQIVALNARNDNDPVAAADLAAQLSQQLQPMLNAHDYSAYFVATREQVLASGRSEVIGRPVPSEFRRVFERVYDGETTVTPPYASLLPQRDPSGRELLGVPVMNVLAPLVDDNLQTIAVLALQLRPEKDFTRILQIARLGDSGETYAFDANGLMLSNSRFGEDLVLLGLLPDLPRSESILQLLVRDPGGDMTRGYRPGVRRAELPLTTMVEEAVAGRPAANVSGYRDYRGVPVVGAWTWLDRYNFGVATEVNYSEAFRPLTILKRTFWGLLALLAASSVAIFVFTLLVARAQRQAREAAIEARELGQYKLEEKLGEGAMGVVYRGRHAMLRRPTAIKLIDADKVTQTSIERFEREVQITSNLNHPNTIAIYDYGRTPEGVFYYAMEYLDGIDLQSLAEKYGPQPSGRVVYILRQICGSLFEAHSSGLVHRDIKPANVMLNRRGGEGDVVKVLDFGLVKDRDDRSARNGGMAGTPLYMSPEAVQTPDAVDACSDLYSVGAVGYFLVTGKPVFESDDLVTLCRQHAVEPPTPLSTRLGKPVPADLEHAILSCLEKDRARRPQTARDLANMLAGCECAGDWSVDRADMWWGRRERGVPPESKEPPQPPTAGKTQSNLDQTIDL